LAAPETMPPDARSAASTCASLNFSFIRATDRVKVTRINDEIRWTVWLKRACVCHRL
jgi:hypothetical protein